MSGEHTISWWIEQTNKDQLVTRQRPDLSCVTENTLVNPFLAFYWIYWICTVNTDRKAEGERERGSHTYGALSHSKIQLLSGLYQHCLWSSVYHKCSTNNFMSVCNIVIRRIKSLTVLTYKQPLHIVAHNKNPHFILNIVGDLQKNNYMHLLCNWCGGCIQLLTKLLPFLSL